MSTPRIAILCSGLGHVARGIETWADSVATELHRRRLDVTLFKGAGPAARPFERVVPCLRRTKPLVSRLVRAAPRWAWRLGLHQAYDVEQTTFALSILPHLIRKRYDLIHLQDPWLARILEKTRWLHGASVILGHGTEEEAWFLRQFQHVQELTPFYLGRHGDIGNRQWFAVPNFVDTTRFHPGDSKAARRELGLPEDALIVLSASALNRSKKRLDWLAREVAAAGRKDVYLVLAGARETETESLTAEVTELLAGRVRVLENVPHSRMPLLYQAADVHVMCSLKEVMGISIVEAMAAGVMNIVHEWGSVEWVVGETGLVVDMQKSGALAHTISDLSVEACRERGARARQRAVDTFSVEAVADQMLRMYDDVLRHRRRPAERLVPSASTAAI